jgi:predicted ArsR family transcriptional regulator
MTADGTREELLTHIVDHGGATIAELCAALALSDASVRRHVDRLQLDGLLTANEIRQSMGRPYRRYRATDAGVSRQRDRSASLAARLLSQIKHGRHEESEVARGLADEIVAEHRSEVQAVDPGQRIEETVAVLRTEGILDGWEATPSGYTLRNHACPYRSAADQSDCVCESDRLAIESLLGAAVAQVASVVHGDAACEYFVDVADLGPAIQPNQDATKQQQERAQPGQEAPSGRGRTADGQ